MAKLKILPRKKEKIGNKRLKNKNKRLNNSSLLEKIKM